LDHKDSPQFLEQAEINSLFEQYDPGAAARYSASDEAANDQQGPSLPVILVSAASGIAGGVLGLYIAYIALDLNVQASAAVATLALCISLGISGASLSALTGSRSTTGNIALSCGLILLVTVFFGLCTLTGAVFASLVLTWGR
jgi:hypothetical protein